MIIHQGFTRILTLLSYYNIIIYYYWLYYMILSSMIKLNVVVIFNSYSTIDIPYCDYCNVQINCL